MFKFKRSGRSTYLAKSVLLAAITCTPAFAGQASTPSGTPLAPSAVPSTPFGEGWKTVLPIPHPAWGEGDQYVAWVADGWLQARREKSDGTIDWQIVLAQATDPTPPVVEAPKGSMHFGLSYAGGRYLIREDAFILRSVRQRKPEKSAQWPTIKPLVREDHLNCASGAMTQVDDGKWVLVTSGSNRDASDCYVRLCPTDPLVDAGKAKIGGWGGQGFNATPMLCSVFYQDQHGADARVFDDGELLIAMRRLAAPPQVVVGDVAKPFTCSKPDGKRLSLESYRGKYVLLDFWATWCGPCKAELPNLKRIHDTFAKDDHFAMIGLSMDNEADDLKRFLVKEQLPWAQGLIGDGSENPVAIQYGVDAIPMTFLIAPDGKVLARGLRGEDLMKAVSRALQK